MAGNAGVNPSECDCGGALVVFKRNAVIGGEPMHVYECPACERLTFVSVVVEDD